MTPGVFSCTDIDRTSRSWKNQCMTEKETAPRTYEFSYIVTLLLDSPDDLRPVSVTGLYRAKGFESLNDIEETVTWDAMTRTDDGSGTKAIVIFRSVRPNKTASEMWA